MTRLFGTKQSKAPEPMEFIFDESYRISTQEMLDLIKCVSEGKHWVDAMKKDSEPVVTALLMTRMQGSQIRSDRLHCGYCYHDVEQVTAYLIRDKLKRKTLFSAQKYDWQDDVHVNTFVPGNWIDWLKIQEK